MPQRLRSASTRKAKMTTINTNSDDEWVDVEKTPKSQNKSKESSKKAKKKTEERR